MIDECAINRSRTKQIKLSVASRTEPACSAQCGQNVSGYLLKRLPPEKQTKKFELLM